MEGKKSQGSNVNTAANTSSGIDVAANNYFVNESQKFLSRNSRPCVEQNQGAGNSANPGMRLR